MTTQTEIDELIAEIEGWSSEIFHADNENISSKFASTQDLKRRATISKIEELLTELLEKQK